MVAEKAGAVEKTSYTLIGGGVSSESSEGKESFGTVVSDEVQLPMPEVRPSEETGSSGRQSNFRNSIDLGGPAPSLVIPHQRSPDNS